MSDAKEQTAGTPQSSEHNEKKWGALMTRARNRLGGGLREREGIDLIVRVLLMAVVASGCYLIIQPFLTAILLAAVIAVATWPLFDRLRAWCGHRATPAAFLMVSAIVVIFLIPMSFFLIASAQRLPGVVSKIVQTVKDPQPVLDTVRGIPYAGEWLYSELLQAIDPASFGQSIQKILDPLSSAIINMAVDVSNGLLQLALVTFIVFFFYRDGAWFADRVRELLVRVSGGIASEICDILVNTTRSVVYGIIGTAICQGLVAGIGFLDCRRAGRSHFVGNRLPALGRSDRPAARLDPRSRLALRQRRDRHGCLSLRLGRRLHFERRQCREAAPYFARLNAAACPYFPRRLRRRHCVRLPRPHSRAAFAFDRPCTLSSLAQEARH